MPQHHERARSSRGDDDDDDVQYLSLARLTRYSGLSLRTLQRYCKAPVNPLPHLVVRSPGRTAGRGRVLVPKRQFDAWMARTFAAPVPEPPAGPDVSWIRRAFDDA